MKKLLILLAFIPCLLIGQLPQTNLQFRWVAGYQIIESDTCLVDSLTNSGSTSYKLTFCADQLTNITAGYISAKSFCRVNGWPVNTITTYSADSNVISTSFYQMSQHTINADSVEILPYRLESIAKYSVAQTGASKTWLYSYFNVATYPVANLREVGVDKTDTTIAAAITAASAGDKIMIFTGTYNETTLTINKAVNLYAVGMCTLQSTATRVLTISANSNIYGVILDGTNTLQSACRITAGDGSLNNCYITNLTTGGYKVDAGSSTRILNQKQCVYQFVGGSAMFNKTTTTIEECYFKNSGATINCYFTNGLGQTQIVKYCKFEGTRTYDISIGNGYNTQLKFNEYKTGATGHVNLSTAEAGTIIFKGNNLNGSSKGALINISSAGITSAIITANYGIAPSTMASSAAIIGLINCQNITVTSNNIIDQRTENGNIISITSTGTSMVSNITNNTLGSPALTGYCIRVGTEATSANNNKITGNITGNLIYGAKYYNSGLNQTTNLKHSIYVGFNRNFVIKQNYMEGGGLAVIVKADGDSSTTCEISNNVLKNCYQSIRCKGVKGIKIYNNTIYSNTADTVYGIFIDKNIAELREIRETGISMLNNIIKIENATGGNCLISDSSTFTSFNYNVLQTNSVYASINTVTRNYGQLVSDGYNANGFNSDPLFKSSTELWPTGASEAINNGLNLGATYQTGLNPGIVWPNPLTKIQQVPWTIGAYVVREPTIQGHFIRLMILMHNRQILGQ